MNRVALTCAILVVIANLASGQTTEEKISQAIKALPESMRAGASVVEYDAMGYRTVLQEEQTRWFANRMTPLSRASVLPAITRTESPDSTSSDSLQRGVNPPRKSFKLGARRLTPENCHSP